MEFLKTIMDFFLHLDAYLETVITQFGVWTYVILFAVIFVETGLVIMPFLPGDSLLFAAGAFAAKGSLNIWVLFFLLWIAAVVGDSINYWMGSYFGIRVFSEKWKLIKHEHLSKTHKFYEKYGAKTIIFARFVPIIRTIAPFVAGVGSMHYRTFITYNIVGGLVWVALFLFGGYLFGNISFVAKNFEFVILGIIFLSVLPPIIEVLRQKWKKVEPEQSSVRGK